MKNYTVVGIIACLVMTAVMAFSQPVLAQTTTTTQYTQIDTTNLTAEQITALQQQAANARNGTPDQTLENIKAYVEVGKGIGAGVGQAAKELNIAVNDFAKTPVGIVTVSLIVFKVAGGKIIGVFSGILWFLVWGPLWVYYFNRLGFPKKVEITHHENGKIATRVVTPILDDEVYVMRIVAVIVGILISICGFFMLFSI